MLTQKKQQACNKLYKNMSTLLLLSLCDCVTMQAAHFFFFFLSMTTLAELHQHDFAIWERIHLFLTTHCWSFVGVAANGEEEFNKYFRWSMMYEAEKTDGKKFCETRNRRIAYQNWVISYRSFLGGQFNVFYSQRIWVSKLLAGIHRINHRFYLKYNFIKAMGWHYFAFENDKKFY